MWFQRTLADTFVAPSGSSLHCYQTVLQRRAWDPALLFFYLQYVWARHCKVSLNSESSAAREWARNQRPASNFSTTQVSNLPCKPCPDLSPIGDVECFSWSGGCQWRLSCALSPFLSLRQVPRSPRRLRWEFRKVLDFPLVSQSMQLLFRILVCRKCAGSTWTTVWLSRKSPRSAWAWSASWHRHLTSHT